MRHHKCQFCNQNFDSHQKKTQHSRTCDSRYKCNIFEAGFATQALLSTHKKLNHVEKESKKLKCAQRSSSFTRLTNFNKHRHESHSGQQQHSLFHCVLCKEVFFNLPAYQSHILIRHRVETSRHTGVFYSS